MQPNPNDEQALRQKLPIDADEKILAVFKHHWFAYASTWFVTGLATAVVLIGGVTIGLIGPGALSGQYGPAFIVGSILLSIIILSVGSLPAYLRSQERIVLTDESLLQILRPSLMASKVDQIGLDHVANVAVREDFLGTLMGYGHLTIETQGEQDDYEFAILPNPREAARLISSTHEEFDAALQGGRLPTKMGVSQPQGPQVQIDPKQYQEFLKFQQMQQMQQQQQGSSAPEEPADNSAPQQNGE